MREHLSKIVVVALVALVVGVPFALQPSRPAEGDAGERERLIIFSPHNEQIRFEIARAFNAWRIEQGEAPVRFDWRSGGGTGDLRRIVMSQLESRARAGREDQGIEADLFFGGGDFEHNNLARGVTVTRDGERVQIPATVPIDIPDATLEAAFPQPTLGGNRLYHGEQRWVGVVVSSFGIVYNRDVLAMLGVDEPGTWADLQAPAYAGWLALADPGHSGAIAATYHVIVQRHGWDEGWRLLRRVFANARYFTASSSQVPVDVSAGDAAAGMCIDFYGRYQAGAVGDERVGYVDPKHMTATTPDPIAILRGAPNHELAREFVLWLLSRESQRLWQRRAGAPDGPQRFELRRQPVRRDLYGDPGEQRHWTDGEVDPFATAEPLPEGTPDFYLMIAPVAQAMAIDVHADLVRAWRAIRRVDEDDPRREVMIERFERMPPALRIDWPDDELAATWREAIGDEAHPRHGEAVETLRAFGERLTDDFVRNPHKLQRARLEWTRFFRENYRAVAAMGRGR